MAAEPKQPLRALITGGAGFVGLHLARHLLLAGAEVTLLDDFSRGTPDDDFRELRGLVDVVEHDLTAPIPDGLLTGTFGSVYHLASVVGVQRVNENPARVLDVNLRAALHVLDWCRRHPPEAVFLSSTSEVADGAAHLGLTSYPTAENGPFALADPALPRASYALSKVAAEGLFRHDRTGLRVRIGRYHNIYGPRMGHEHVIPQFIARALARQNPFEIYGATQTRAFCHIEDAVAATVALMRLPDPEPLVVNIGNDREEIRIDRLAERVTELAGYRPEFRIFAPPASSPERRLPGLTRLRELTGYEPRIGLGDGLRDTFHWYATHAAPAATRSVGGGGA
ncbi:NAD-dependent epimerase/dehydratase family protein [Amycolatopsis anabasis]|uniref:NAD-dependent epimerase/dehydratase family protein n=1 Tax=Amycolatopsis anabasis TaxID=1840409 RepID=UPI001C5507D0|nr:NAD-dependent epimerase/dehydratase family protein [Amycolatopsis anabasis]